MKNVVKKVPYVANSLSDLYVGHMYVVQYREGAEKSEGPIPQP